MHRNNSDHFLVRQADESLSAGIIPGSPITGNDLFQTAMDCLDGRRCTHYVAITKYYDAKTSQKIIKHYQRKSASFINDSEAHHDGEGKELILDPSQV